MAEQTDEGSRIKPLVYYETDEVGTSPLTVARGTETELALVQIDEFVEARAKFRSVFNRFVEQAIIGE